MHLGSAGDRRARARWSAGWGGGARGLEASREEVTSAVDYGAGAWGGVWGGEIARGGEGDEERDGREGKAGAEERGRAFQEIGRAHV